MAEQVRPEELAKVLGQIKEEVTIGEKTIVITPFKTKQFIEVLKCIDSLAAVGVVDLSGDVGNAAQEFDPVRMVLRGGDQILQLLHIATSLPVEELGELDLVDTVKLTAAVFTTNLDFFVKSSPTLKQALGPAWDALRSAVGGVTFGLPQLTGSSAPATA